MTDQSEFLQFGAIRISSAHLEELQDGHPIVSVNRQEIRSYHIRYGFLARHPIIQAIFGVVLTLFSTAFLIAGIASLIQGRIMLVPLLAGGFVWLGLWIVLDAIKRGHFIEVWTDKGPTKLVIGRRVGEHELSALSLWLGK